MPPGRPRPRERYSRSRNRALSRGDLERVGAGLLHAYRWQYLLSGVQVPHFSAILGSLLNPEQHGRIAAALAPLFDASALPAVRAEG